MQFAISQNCSLLSSASFCFQKSNKSVWAPCTKDIPANGFHKFLKYFDKSHSFSCRHHASWYVTTLSFSEDGRCDFSYYMLSYQGLRHVACYRPCGGRMLGKNRSLLMTEDGLMPSGLDHLQTAGTPAHDSHSSTSAAKCAAILPRLFPNLLHQARRSGR